MTGTLPVGLPMEPQGEQRKEEERTPEEEGVFDEPTQTASILER